MFFRKRLLVVIAVLILVYSFTIFISCNNIQRNNSHPGIPDANVEKGKILAEKYCQSCHAFPDPSLLDSKTWEKGVLPAMGPRLGIFYFNYTDYPSSRNDMSLEKDFYPKKPVIELEEWKNIISYYVATSPDTLDEQKTAAPIEKKSPLFSIKIPQLRFASPATALVKINRNSSGAVLFTSDAAKQVFYRFNKNLEVIDSLKTNGPIVDVEFNDGSLVTCNPGIMNPHNGRFGSAGNILIKSCGRIQQDSAVLFRGLARPVQITTGDLNNDGKKDYVVCEFGYLTGALSWMENIGNGKFIQHVLRPLPGAIKAYIQDYNRDGLQDLWVLFSQGEEGIFLFTNKGNGKFEQKEVLRFPPVYGSSYFEFADFNKDGHPDIVYTCGDNADYSPVLKPYHGVYIFINDGNNNFKQQYFFHINGCYKALARDFDNDGDLDIAMISFFADYLHTPAEGFVYLENKGNFTFDPFTLGGTEQGRWLTMDAGDINSDGKIDLILGNFSVAPSFIKSKSEWEKGPPFIVLENLGKRR